MPSTPNDEKKTLILTGASRGIGHATVKLDLKYVLTK